MRVFEYVKNAKMKWTRARGEEILNLATPNNKWTFKVTSRQLYTIRVKIYENKNYIALIELDRGATGIKYGIVNAWLPHTEIAPIADWLCQRLWLVIPSEYRKQKRYLENIAEEFRKQSAGATILEPKTQVIEE